MVGMEQNRMRAATTVRKLGLTLVLSLTVGLLPVTPAQGQSSGGHVFDDVPHGHIAEAAIKWAASNGVTRGVGNNLFGMGQTLKREQMVTFLCRAYAPTECEAGTTAGSDRFADVPAGHYADFSIGWAHEQGITTGVGADRFGLGQTLTREQIATFLYRAEGSPGTGPTGGSVYGDVPGDGSEWYQKPIGWSYEQGIVGGVSAASFGFGTTVVREEMVLSLCRAVAEDVCPAVTAPPTSLNLDPFYEKHLDAGGIPVVSSGSVADHALVRAGELIGEMLSFRPDLRREMSAFGVRVSIMAESSVITDLPEFSDLYARFPGTDWDERVRGGGLSVIESGLTVIAEENLLCYNSDVFPHEDIFVHEFAHTVLGVWSRTGGADFLNRLEIAYHDGLAAGLWADTYAAENPHEYWAEGVQSWFDLNDPPGPIHNDVNTRAELADYDPVLAALIKEMFGEANVASSCHPLADRADTVSISGVVLGPSGQPLEGIGLWAWQGEVASSGWGTTGPDGTFRIEAPAGSFTLDIYIDPSAACSFVGWYGPGGFTTARADARLIEASGDDVSGIRIILPDSPSALPFIEWCAP